MVGMWIAVGAGVAVVVGLILAAVLRRPSHSDFSSVNRYHTAIDILEHLPERTTGGSVRPVGPYDATGAGVVPLDPGREAGRKVPPVPVRGSEVFPDPETPLVFDDARPPESAAGQGHSTAPPPSRESRSQRLALQSMNHRPRRQTSAIVVVVVIAAFGALAYYGSTHSTTGGRSGRNTATTTSGSTHPAGSTSPQGSRGGKGKGKGTKSGGGPGTSVPAQIVATSSTATTAAYSVPSGTYTVTMTTSGPCWVDASTPSTGATLWTGTLQAGASQVVEATGSTSIEFGAATVEFTIGGVPVALPVPIHTPFTATFTPESAGTSTPAT